MIGLIKRHKTIFILVVGLLFFTTFLIIVSGGLSPLAPQPTPLTDPWSSFQPGVTTKEQVISKLGTPISQQTQDSQSVLDFKSNSPTRNNVVTFTEDISGLFKHIIAYGETLSVKDMTSKYGTATNILYGPDATAGFYLFAYPEKGVAYLGNPVSGDLLEVWYFPSTTIENFLVQWAKAYSKTFPQAQ